MGRTAPLTPKVAFYIFIKKYFKYFKHGIYSPFYPLQNVVCFIILTYLVPVLFTFYIQSVPKLKKNNSGAKRLIKNFILPLYCLLRYFLSVCSKFSSRHLPPVTPSIYIFFAKARAKSFSRTKKIIFYFDALNSTVAAFGLVHFCFSV